MLGSARRNYDRIVVYCAALPGDGANNVYVPEADRVLLVVPSDSLHATSTGRAIDELKRRGAKQVGLVLGTETGDAASYAVRSPRQAGRERGIPGAQPFPAE